MEVQCLCHFFLTDFSCGFLKEHFVITALNKVSLLNLNDHNFGCLKCVASFPLVFRTKRSIDL